MHQICADGVAPVNVSMHRGVWIVLVEEVILPLPLDEAIRVIHPVCLRQEVIVWSMWVAKHCLNLFLTN